MRRKIHDTLTTGEMANMCNVSARMIGIWCDTGLIKHHHIPNSKIRRILISDAKEFMAKQGLPLYKLMRYYPNAKQLVYYASQDLALLEELKTLHPMAEFVHAPTLFALGSLFASAPSTVILDLALGRSECLLATDYLTDEKLILVAEADEQEPKYLKAITPRVLYRPFPASYLMELL